MKYTGKFKTVYDDSLYTVNIITNGDSSIEKEVTLGTPPLTVTLEGSEGNLYKPVKYSSATIKMVNDDYSFDLYSSKAQQNAVTIYNNTGNIEWIGYTTPNLYSQGYENEVEEIEIECIDALATLQYYEYKPCNGTSKQIVKFIDIINNIAAKCNAYNGIYVTTSMRLGNNVLNPIINHLYISENNFFDEDDKPMTYQEVLEQLCQYMNYTCVAYNDNLYFLDYDAIKNNENSYYYYNVGSTAYTTVNCIHNYDINGSDYRENGGVISLDNTYNRATVKSSLYGFKSVIPDLFDVDVLQPWGGKLNYTENLEVIESKGKGGKYKLFYRYYKNPNYKTYYYNMDLTSRDEPEIMNYQFMQDNVGCTIVKACFKDVEDYDDTIGELNFTDYLLFHCHNTNRTDAGENDEGGKDIKLEDEQGKLAIELTMNDNQVFIGGDNTYLLIKGDYLMMDRKDKDNESILYIVDGYKNAYDQFNPKNLWIKAELSIDGKYWNGDWWQTTQCYFKLPFANEGKSDHHCNVNFPILNNYNWEAGIEENGYAIKLPDTVILKGNINLKLFQPHRLDNEYQCCCVFIKNFDIQVVIADPQLSIKQTTDTEYYNIIDDDYANDMDEIVMKICTWDDKEPNYSCVAKGNDGEALSYLNKTYNCVTNQELRQEEHLIYRLVNQYKEPAVILELSLNNIFKPYSLITDKWLPDRKFIIDSYEVDYEYQRMGIKIIQKK